MLKKQLSRKFEKEVSNFPLLPAFGSESMPDLDRLRVAGTKSLDMEKAIIVPSKPETAMVGGNLERKFMLAQLKPASRQLQSPAQPGAPSKSKKENYAPVGPSRREEEVFFKVKPAISKVQLKTSASTVSLQKPRPSSGGCTFSLRNLNTPGTKIPSSAIKETPSLKTISASSMDLRKSGPQNSKTKSSDTPGEESSSAINIRDAIRLNDHVRIRKGSPGSHSQGKIPMTFVIGGADRYKTLD
jgi:hypothetical protein